MGTDQALLEQMRQLVSEAKSIGVEATVDQDPPGTDARGYRVGLRELQGTGRVVFEGLYPEEVLQAARGELVRIARARAQHVQHEEQRARVMEDLRAEVRAMVKEEVDARFRGGV